MDSPGKVLEMPFHIFNLFWFNLVVTFGAQKKHKKHKQSWKWERPNIWYQLNDDNSVYMKMTEMKNMIITWRWVFTKGLRSRGGRKNLRSRFDRDFVWGLKVGLGGGLHSNEVELALRINSLHRSLLPLQWPPHRVLSENDWKKLKLKYFLNKH